MRQVLRSRVVNNSECERVGDAMEGGVSVDEGGALVRCVAAGGVYGRNLALLQLA